MILLDPCVLFSNHDDNVTGVGCRLGHSVSPAFQVCVRAEVSHPDEGRGIVVVRIATRLRDIATHTSGLCTLPNENSQGTVQ